MKLFNWAKENIIYSFVSIFTFLWAILWFKIAYDQYQIKGPIWDDLAEAGTFFGGIFGPVALIWLIIGYFRQNQEIIKTSEALETQEVQLSNVIKQLSASADALATSANAQLSLAKHETIKSLKATGPYIRVFGSAQFDKKYQHTFHLINEGLDMSMVDVECLSEGLDVIKRDIGYWATGESNSITVCPDDGDLISFPYYLMFDYFIGDVPEKRLFKLTNPGVGYLQGPEIIGTELNPLDDEKWNDTDY